MSRGNLQAGGTITPVQHSKVRLPQTLLTVEMPSLLRMLCKYELHADKNPLDGMWRTEVDTEHVWPEQC